MLITNRSVRDQIRGYQYYNVSVSAILHTLRLGCDKGLGLSHQYAEQSSRMQPS